jgi:hypothetical protein
MPRDLSKTAAEVASIPEGMILCFCCDMPMKMPYTIVKAHIGTDSRLYDVGVCNACLKHGPPKEADNLACPLMETRNAN